MTKPKTGNAVCDALDVILQLDALDDLAERRRYDLAASEREQARSLRRWAEALRVVHERGARP